MRFFDFERFAPFQTSLADYLNACMDVASYAAAISQTNLPSMAGSPQWYTDFFANWINVKSDAMSWDNGVGANALAMLKMYRDDDIYVAPELAQASVLVQLLIDDPKNPDAKALLHQRPGSPLPTPAHRPSTSGASP